MTYLLALSILANVGAVAFFLIHLTARDERERKERVHLLNRIQAPQQAVAESVEPSDEPQHVSEFKDFKEPAE